MLDHLLDQIGPWVLEHQKEFWPSLVIYFSFFVIVEMIIHEFGHYYFQRKFGIRVVFFQIGIFSLYSQVLKNGTKVILGIPCFKAESRGLGELADEMKEKDNPEAFYYRHRHPKEQFIVAIAGPLTVLAICGFIFGVYYASWKLFAIPVPTYLMIAFGMVIFTELSNLLIPLKFCGLGTDAWIAYRAIWEWCFKKGGAS